ncbi:MAG: ATP-binding protein [Acidimicrobiia bacterium]|nr:ATP-binding protein [Acidimicrobiia bacterium]
MSSGPRLIIVCGLPGSGKTTHAEQLAALHGGFRLSADDWMGVLDINLWDGDARDRIERLQWELAQDLLRRGQTVIIEWGTWGRSERDALREGARALGAAVELHYLDEPIEVLWERVRDRGLEDPPMTREQLESYADTIDVPTDEELALYD